MSQDEILTKEQEDEYQEPGWLVHKLQVAGDYAAFTSEIQPAVSEHFRERARRAAQIAYVLNRLRAEREKIGFVAMAIGDYVQGIVKVNQLKLGSALAWLGITDITKPDLKSAAGFARLGLELGLNQVELMTHIRIAIAGFSGSIPMIMLIARRRAGATGRSDLQECISILNEIEAKYDQSVREELRLIAEEIEVVYRKQPQ